MASKKTPASKKPQVQPRPVKKKTVAPVGVTLTMAQVKEVIGLLRSAETFNTFLYKTPDFELEIELRKKAGANESATNLAPKAQLANQVIAPPQAPISAAAVKPVRTKNAYEILSPMVGTFYRRPNPDSPPFVELGSLVNEDTPVCIVEVMKLLNTISTPHKGHVSEICVEDGAIIEAGQVLMVIELV